MDWNADPELKAIRDEFIASLADRRSSLAKILNALGASGPGVPVFGPALVDLQFVAHKLGGTAESYGFPTLTLVASCLDEYLDRFVKDPALAERSELERIVGFGRFLDEVVASAQGGDDPSAFVGDGRTEELITASGVDRSLLRLPKGN